MSYVLQTFDRLEEAVKVSSYCHAAFAGDTSDVICMVDHLLDRRRAADELW